jgi:hypothetical protein
MRGHFVFKSHLYVALFQVVETLSAASWPPARVVGKGVSEACCSQPITFLSSYPNERYPSKYRQPPSCIVCHIITGVAFSMSDSNSVACMRTDREV